ncbi:ATP-binding protein [Novosphingobium sp.]|jgi:PAS domain S-box-containing protein|uniref:sensor histidine kinase n=1 Tax=Novosphingobium sp. TaxID=1874826 RepID=UPI0022C96DE1|nr:ATP-binding protein [Novosphingobium sp.]MCZ8017507.1 CHASE3 domain-containing protein [Novosphingobium sp.]MCZ8033969.1 CHASE3 domain-containing protein [Novosphingobium sp.]MCZ8051325.1 CHASE3 domain-containing protein [Novosphingobium sp.]MCZ8059671.1 CHASE3 domain-containing protein [Novosphingobium sp.]MCZ8231509.1 CHASE3 domain-containing protein [Novosphingobium sp.]
MARGRANPLNRFWADRPLALKGLVVVALPLAILFGALVLLYFASVAESRAEDDVRRAFAIQRDTYQVHALLAEAAAGARGYALTGQERFLEPYRKAEASLPQTMVRLDGEIRDPEVRQRFERIRGLTTRKREGLARIVELSQGGSGNSALIGEALSANKVVLDAMRAEIDAIQQRENVLLNQRRERVEQVRDRFLMLTAISAVVGLLGSLAAVYLFSTGIVRRVRTLEDNAERLAEGEALLPHSDDADEIGRLAHRLARASALLRGREQALRESEERFRLVIDGVRDYGIFTLDSDGVVTSWNPGAERIKGWQAQEILGDHFSKFYPDETRGFLPAAMLDRARQNGTAEDEGWRVRKDGSLFWANVVITALRDENGALRGFAKITRDMTERRRSEEALRVAREEAIAASLAKSEFLSRTSHELRTPMSAILGFGQLLELDEEQFGEQHRAAITQIMKAGRHLLSLINDLLDISSIEAGGTQLSIEPLDMGEVLGEVHGLAAPIVASAGLKFELDAPVKKLVAHADRRRVIQVMLNLIANAAKYHGSGTCVRLKCRSDGAAIRIEVEDDGDGVEPAAVSRLFTPFDRLGQQNRTRLEGTGLGLALSQKLVESMGGAIGYAAPARGARFWFTIPALARPRPAAESPAEIPAETGPPSIMDPA